MNARSKGTQTYIDGKRVKRWITINGNHVPVFMNENNTQAGERFVKEKQDEKPKEDTKKDTKSDESKETPTPEEKVMPLNEKLKLKHIGKYVTIEYQNRIKNAWKYVPESYKITISRMNLSAVKRKKRMVGGFYKESNKQITMHDIKGMEVSQQEVSNILLHEFAHAKWAETDNVTRGKWKEWVDANPSMRHTTEYANSYFENTPRALKKCDRVIAEYDLRIKNTESRGEKANLELRKKEWEDFREWKEWLPYNELHSEVFAHHHFPKEQGRYGLKKDKLEIAWKKYVEVFGEK